MDNIGAEVGQKMRSAIKAKLMELGCYVDDELPDYVMVMVANKRTKTQMNADLQLFLTTKTAAFVEWLQIVLKKLEEVTVTNPDVYKKVTKRKLELLPKANIKKEKKEKKMNKKIKTKEPPKQVIKDLSDIKSLTDDLPVEASALSEKRKIVVMQESQSVLNMHQTNTQNVNEDNFDIPSLSEVNMSNESELLEIQKKIKSVKNRLGIQVQSDSEDEDFVNIKLETDDLFSNDQLNTQAEEKNKEQQRIKLVRSVEISKEKPQNFPTNDSSLKTVEHHHITYGDEKQNVAKKKSVLERLGKRPNSQNYCDAAVNKRTRISLKETKEEEEAIRGAWNAYGDKRFRTIDETTLGEQDVGKLHRVKDKISNADGREIRESALKRLGVMSKVAIPTKEPDSQVEEIKPKEVPSCIKVKPRIIPTRNQANKNLLLKAVAEAQRSVAQTPLVGNNAKPDALYTKRYREKISRDEIPSKKLCVKEKDNPKTIVIPLDETELEFSSDDDNLEYVPKPVVKGKHEPQYIPSSKDAVREDFGNKDFALEYKNLLNKKSINQKFIITLDGIEKNKYEETSKMNVLLAHDSNLYKSKQMADKIRRTPSPIVFKGVSSTKAKLNSSIVKITSNSSIVKAIPEQLPVVYSPLKIKTKEKCKYWPACRQGELCEYLHPSTACKLFPQCKFGDKCIYIHPPCKFETSCTRRGCPFSHISRNIIGGNPTQSLQTCKFFPNCNNSSCTFYHPRPCKFGKYCKNQAECNFLHNFPASSNLMWHSNLK